MTYYAVYEPAVPTQGDGEFLGPYHQQREAHKAAADLVEQVKAGIKPAGRVIVMDEWFKAVETLLDTQEAQK